MEQFAQYGAIGAVLAFMLALVRISIGAERRRADDWRAAAATSKEANERLSAQVDALRAGQDKLIAAVDRQTVTLAELLRSLGPEHRSAA